MINFTRDAVLARIGLLAVALCLSVSVSASVKSGSSIEMAERIGLVLVWELLSI